MTERDRREGESQVTPSEDQGRIVLGDHATAVSQHRSSLSRDEGSVQKDAAYYDEVRQAVGRGTPTLLLGTSTRSLERSLKKLKAVQQDRLPPPAASSQEADTETSSLVTPLLLAVTAGLMGAIGAGVAVIFTSATWLGVALTALLVPIFIVMFVVLISARREDDGPFLPEDQLTRAARRVTGLYVRGSAEIHGSSKTSSESRREAESKKI